MTVFQQDQLHSYAQAPVVVWRRFPFLSLWGVAFALSAGLSQGCTPGRNGGDPKSGGDSGPVASRKVLPSGPNAPGETVFLVMGATSASVTTASGTGLEADYFDSTELQGTPRYQRIDPSINFPDLGTKRQDPALPSASTTSPYRSFGIRWTGQIKTGAAGNYTFSVSADDGVRVWVNSTKIIDRWNYDSKDAVGTIGLQASTRYDIKVEYRNTGGDGKILLYWSVDGAARALVPQSALFPAPPFVGTGTGLKGDYYNNQDFTELLSTRIDPFINFVNTGGQSPVVDIDPYTYSVRWTGQVQAQYSELYTFYTQSDDGVRLWVNGKKIINNWGDHGLTENSGTIQLEAGKKVDIELQYYQGGGGAGISLLWSSASQDKGVIPRSQLYPVGFTEPTPANGVGTGLTAEYFKDRLFQSRVLSVIEPQVNFSAPSGVAPKPGMPVSDYSIRWSGQLLADFSETYTFKLDVDDQVEFRLDGNLVFSRSSYSSTPALVPINLQAGKRYAIEIRFIQGGGPAKMQLAWASKSQTQNASVLVPADHLFPVAPVLGTGKGLRGDYYVNRSLGAPFGTRADPTIQFGSISPGVFPLSGMGSTDFSVRWTGQVQAPYSETFTFYTHSDDGVRLWVNGLLLINNWTDHGPTINTGTLALKAGEKVDLKLEYYQGGGSGLVSLSWSSLSLKKEIIPASQLFYPAGWTPNPVSSPTAVPTPVPSPTMTGTGSGLTGTYFTNTTLSGPSAATRVDGPIHFPDVTLASARPAGISSVYSVRWNGEVEAPSTESYTFWVTADDNVRIRINQVLVLDRWYYVSAASSSQAVSFEKGKRYPIEIEFANTGGPGKMILEWSSASLPRAVVPQRQLYPAVSTQPSPTASPSSSPKPSPVPSTTSTPTPTPSPSPGAAGPLSFNLTSFKILAGKSTSLVASGGSPSYTFTHSFTSIAVPEDDKSNPQRYRGTVTPGSGGQVIYNAPERLGYYSYACEKVQVKDSSGTTAEAMAYVLPPLNAGVSSPSVIGGEDVYLSAAGGSRPFQASASAGTLVVERTIPSTPQPPTECLLAARTVFKTLPDVWRFKTPVVSQPTDFTFTIKDADGAVSSVKVTVNPAPQPQIKSLVTEVMAPGTVHVKGTDLLPATGDLLNARYEWLFNDPNSTVQTVPSPSGSIQYNPNQLVGWNAAHTYDRAQVNADGSETPATYKVELRMTDANGTIYRVRDASGNWVLPSVAVVVKPNTRKKVYVGEKPANAPADALQISSFDEISQVLKRPSATSNAFPSLPDDRNGIEFLFKKGVTYPVGSGLYFGNRNIRFTTWGTGSRPILWWNGVADGKFFDFDGRILADGRAATADILIEGLALDGPANPVPNAKNGISYVGYEKSNVRLGIRPQGENFTIRDCWFGNISTAVQLEAGPKGVLVMGNSSPLETGLRAYFVFGVGDSFTILGNYVANSTREHVIRIAGASHVLVANNDFANLNRYPLDVDDGSKGCITLQLGKYLYATGNTCRTASIGTGPLGGDNGLHGLTDRTHWVVMEGNTGYYGGLSVSTGANHVMLRNNLNYTGEAAIFLDAYEKGYETRLLTDVRIFNNTVILDESGDKKGHYGKFISIQGRPQGVQLANNLFHAPLLETGAFQSAGVFATDVMNLSDFTLISNNFWAYPKIGFGGGINFICSSWGGDDYSLCYRNADEWNSMALGGGGKVINDLFGKTEIDSAGAPIRTTYCLAGSGGTCQDASAAGDRTKAKGVFTDLNGKLRPVSGPWSAGAIELN